MGKKRAQAAVEFLTVYGWAIMAVIIVIGALSYFDLLDAKRFVSERCDLGSQIECVEVYTNDVGDFKIGLRNNYPVDIVIEKVKIEGIDIVDSNVPIPSGQIQYISGAQSLGEQQKGTKDEYNILITFKRDAFTAVRSYNISGGIIAKVHDSDSIVVPEGFCGDGNVQSYLNEECDLSPDRACTSFSGGWQSGFARCDVLTCQWDMSDCTSSSDPCGNGFLDVDETCDASATGYEPALCSEVLPGTSGQAQCNSNCEWDTSNCQSIVGSTCTSTSECIIGQICIQGLCSDSCADKASLSICGDQGCLCSVGIDPYTSSGICTLTSPMSPSGSCDILEAAYDSSTQTFYSDCTSLTDRACAIILAGGFEQIGTCDTNGDCIAEVPNGDACTSGNDCVSDLCVDSRCVDSCMGHMGINCSVSSDTPYTSFGICTMQYGASSTDPQSYECDKELASYNAGIYYSNCGPVGTDNPLTGFICDSNSLAGGAVADGHCDAGECVLDPGVQTCTSGADCNGFFCVNGYCSLTCSASEINLCSDGDMSYFEQGICTQDVTGSIEPAPLICDDRIAVDATATDGVIYSACTPETEEMECDADELQGGYTNNGKCVESVCVLAI